MFCFFTFSTIKQIFCLYLIKIIEDHPYCVESAAENCAIISHQRNGEKPNKKTYTDVVAMNISQKNTVPSSNLNLETSSKLSNYKIDMSLLLKIRGLPWTTTKKDLRDFFVGVKLFEDLNGIHFISDDQNNFGVAYVQLASKKDYELAQRFHKKKLDGRYIEGKFRFWLKCCNHMLCHPSSYNYFIYFPSQ